MTPAPIRLVLRSDALALIARAALTSAYWYGGTAKLLDQPGALAEARHFGLEPAIVVVVATIAVELAASALIIASRLVWLAAGALGVFTAVATLIAHRFWTLDDPVARFHSLNTFLEHLGLIGGLVLVAVLSERIKQGGGS